jgi:hypothetical protein
MFCNQHHLNHSGNKLWAGMFQTSLINLSCYSRLLSMSFVMNVTDIYPPYDWLWSQFYENLVTFLSLLSLNSSMYNLSMLSLYPSRHTPTVFTININLFRCNCFLAIFDGWFASLPLRVFRPNLGTRFFLGGKAVAEPTWIIPAQVRESMPEGSNVLQTV